MSPAQRNRESRIGGSAYHPARTGTMILSPTARRQPKDPHLRIRHDPPTAPQGAAGQHQDDRGARRRVPGPQGRHQVPDAVRRRRGPDQRRLRVLTAGSGGLRDEVVESGPARASHAPPCRGRRRGDTPGSGCPGRCRRVVEERARRPEIEASCAAIRPTSPPGATALPRRTASSEPASPAASAAAEAALPACVPP